MMTTALFNHLRSLSVSSCSLYGGFLIRKAGVFVVAMMLTRFVGKAEFGVFCVALVVLEFAARLAVFGSDVIVVRAISTHDPAVDSLLATVLGWRCMAGIAIGLVLVSVMSWMSPASALLNIIAIMSMGMVFQVIGDLYISISQGMERVDLGGYVQMLCAAVGVTLMLVAIVFGFGLVGVAVAYSVRSLLFMICGFVLSRYLQRPVRPSVDLRMLLTTLRQGVPIAGNRLLAVLYLGSGLLVLERVCGPESAGAFAGPMKMFEACAALGMLTAVAVFPTLSRLRQDAKDEFRGMVSVLIGVIVWVGVPLCMLVGLHADALLGKVFGHEFLGEGILLVILMCALPLSFSYVLMERLAYAACDQKWVLVVRFLGTAVCLAVLFATVGTLGSVGASLALFAGEAVMVLLFLPRWSYYSFEVSIVKCALPGFIVSVASLGAAIMVSRWGGGAQSVAFFSILFLGVVFFWAWRRNRLRRVRACEDVSVGAS